MTLSALYPPSPVEVPENLTTARSSYRRHAWLAMAGLLAFMLIYIALMLCFGSITYYGVLALMEGGVDLFKLVITPCAGLLTLFMAKSLFAVRRAGDPRGIEVTAEQQPELFAFINTLADEIGAPKPHRVFLTPEVNAAVFYDLSLLNLIFPSRKNLIIGLGLVNVLSLGELKAVLAHEFGHFAQRSMLVGRWVYIAQQIIGHMVVTRDWLDSVVRFIGRIDLRIAWIGWLLALVIWSIRAVVDSLFSLVIMAERALSREMEFNADLVAVSVTGSDALIDALHKLQAADHAWQTALDVAEREAGQGNRITDLFSAQRVSIETMRHILDDQQYGSTPSAPEGADRASFRVFSEAMARPPQMWATHPANRDREENAKAVYVAAPIEARTAWAIFDEPAKLRTQISDSFYVAEKRDELATIAAKEAVTKRFARKAYEPRYQGSYLNRSPMRNFDSVEELLAAGEEKATAEKSLAAIYPAELKALLESARNLDLEADTLSALQRGDLKPSGGVIRHRGEELKKAEIPEALAELAKERQVLTDQLKQHDASCRRAHLQAARKLGGGWAEYLEGLVRILHCVEHMAAKARDEQALLVNTWQVITADGQIGYFEKRRMVRVCEQVQATMREVYSAMSTLNLPDKILNDMGVENWAEQCPLFSLVDVNKKNWADWCAAANDQINLIAGVLEAITNQSLEELVHVESQLEAALADNTVLPEAPKAPAVTHSYPRLMPEQENTLQRKLDLWNRFQLAHGFFPTTARLMVAISIVGGTIYGGWMVI